MKSIHGMTVLSFVFAAAACHKSTQATDTSDAVAAASASVSIVAAAAPDDEADAGDVTPPEAIVAADPNIPLNEAVVGTAPLPANYAADIAPPAAVVEQQPASPEPDDTWVPGYWWWSLPLHRYVWVSGAWRRPPPDQVWVAGSWNPSAAHYVWAPGYWGPRGATREMIDVAPPPLRAEFHSAPPGVGYAWTPGYYGYRGGSYNWIGGTWVRPPAVGVTWVEPRYVSSGGRYCLQPGRWDFPAERRGVVYRPDINVRAGARVVLAPVPPTMVAVHANFVAQSSHAIARGAVRMPNGGFVIPHPNVAPQLEVHEVGRPGENPRARVEEEHVAPHVEAHVEHPEHPEHPEQRQERAPPTVTHPAAPHPQERERRGR